MGDRNNDARLLDLDTSNCEQYKVSDLLIKLRDKMLHQQNTKSAFSDIIYLYEKILTHVCRALLDLLDFYEISCFIEKHEKYREWLWIHDFPATVLSQTERKSIEDVSIWSQSTFDLSHQLCRSFCNALEHGKSAENLAFILPDIFARERSNQILWSNVLSCDYHSISVSDDIQLQDPIKLLVALNGSIDGSSEVFVKAVLCVCLWFTCIDYHSLHNLQKCSLHRIMKRLFIITMILYKRHFDQGVLGSRQLTWWPSSL